MLSLLSPMPQADAPSIRIARLAREQLAVPVLVGTEDHTSFESFAVVGSEFRPGELERERLAGLSRKVQRRLHRRERKQSKVKNLSRTLAELEGGSLCRRIRRVVGSSMTLRSSTLLGWWMQWGLSTPPGMSPQGAFPELQGTLDYASERCDLAPFDIGQLSLPGPSFRPQPLLELLTAEETSDVERMLRDIVLPKSERVAHQRKWTCDSLL